MMYPTIFQTRLDSARELLGREDDELERLMMQSRVFAPLTREVLERAKVGRGMRVLDVACGAGDVSLLVAELVGPLGEVVGVDRSPAAVDLATRRAAFDGHGNVRFVVADAHDVPTPWAFDAVVGRFFMMFQRDQVATLARIASYVRPGGMVVLQEMDIARGMDTLPAAPMWDRAADLVRKILVKADCDVRAGMRLPITFRDAGIEPLGSHYAARLQSGGTSEAYPVMAATLRTLLPIAEELGMVEARQIHVETLADRLREESVALGTMITTPVSVGVWGRAAA